MTTGPAATATTTATGAVTAPTTSAGPTRVTAAGRAGDDTTATTGTTAGIGETVTTAEAIVTSVAMGMAIGLAVIIVVVMVGGRTAVGTEAVTMAGAEPTENSKLSSAELCRRNGWTVGTRLVGDEGYGPDTITITAIGERHILARSDYQLMNHETIWTLHCRDWKVAT